MSGGGLLGAGFETPEQAALSGYPAGEARVLDIRRDDEDRATVRTEVNPSTGYAVWEYCERHDGRWYSTGYTGPAPRAGEPDW